MSSNSMAAGALFGGGRRLRNYRKVDEFYVFGHAVARRRNCGARSGRSVLKSNEDSRQKKIHGPKQPKTVKNENSMVSGNHDFLIYGGGEGWENPEKLIKITFSAMRSRGEGIAGRDWGVRY